MSKFFKESSLHLCIRTIVPNYCTPTQLTALSMLGSGCGSVGLCQSFRAGAEGCWLVLVRWELWLVVIQAAEWQQLWPRHHGDWTHIIQYWLVTSFSIHKDTTYLTDSQFWRLVMVKGPRVRLFLLVVASVGTVLGEGNKFLFDALLKLQAIDYVVIILILSLLSVKWVRSIFWYINRLNNIKYGNQYGKIIKLFMKRKRMVWWSATDSQFKKGHR